ncbi:MAG: hypothetical protein H0W43_02060 [Chthoniobacterales bacterium]|nr:hypothetical protein [Chthoniobacterales bacterium]MBA3607291.1 hypothetical protein [Chthoniobacterales bacterium]
MGPLLLVAIGLGSGAAFIGRYHWFFLSAAIAVLAWAWVKHFREKARCACERRVMYGLGMSLLTLLLASAIVMAFAALNISSYVFAVRHRLRRHAQASNSSASPFQWRE